jgi:integrase
VIRLRGNTYMTDFEIEGHGRVRVSLKTSDKAEAMKRATAKYTELCVSAPKPKSTTTGTIGELLDFAYDYHWSKLRNTQDSKTLCSRLKSTIGEHVRAETVDISVIKQLRADLEEADLTPATRNRYVSALVAAYNFVIERERHKEPVPPHLRGLVAPPILKEAEPPGRIRYLSVIGDPKLGEHPQGELGQLLDAEDDFAWRCFWAFLYESGARPSDALSTPWAAVDFQQGTFYNPNTKTNHPQAVPLSERTMTALRALKTAGKAQPFGWGYWTMRTRFNRLKERAKLNDETVTAYTFRHTCATQLLANGADIRDVQVWLGHSTIKTTERYAKVMPTKLIALRRRMDEAAAGAVPKA